MTAFKAFIVLTLLATGSCSSLPQAGDEEYESRPKADEGYKVCKNPLKWSTPGCKKLFETMKKENPTEKNTGRIINGEDVPFGEYPWFAKPLEYWAGWYGCGSMLVSPEWVLTAAHCLEDDATTHYQIGAVCNNGSNCGESSETINVAERISHPSYDKNAGTNDYDFALVKLAERASTTPVDMDLDGTADSYNSNSKLWAIGFGDTNPGEAQELPTRKQRVEVSYVSQATCNANYYGLITNNMMCAADPGEDSCQGDSGGPLYDAVNNLLVGVVSWGYGCAAEGYPGVYSKIFSQADWIKSTICENHSTPLPLFCAGYSPRPTPAPTTASPTSLCLDFPNFIDTFGDDCSFYSNPELCSQWGSSMGTGMQSNVTVNQACCNCGGGALAPEPACNDWSSWIDSYGDGCDVYRTEWCGSTAELYYNDEGVDANDACCACGGGDTEDVPDDVLPGESCNDLPSWTDVGGDDCSWYEISSTSDYCEVSETYADSDGVGAAEACCLCGGGVVTVNDPPEESCLDSPTRLMINKKKKSCKWVANNAITRCLKKGVASHCPETCGLCSEYECADSEKKWYLKNGKKKKCGWVGRKNSEDRCAMEGVKQTCRATCGECNLA